MSQFDFPRINFHGAAFLDTPTANNGYVNNLQIFDQTRSTVFMPPRIMFDPTKVQPPPGAVVYTDQYGNSYINPLNITADNFQQWCTYPMGSYPADSSYLSFYQAVNNAGMNPGYWNYYGDISMALQNVLVTGITYPNVKGKPVTYSPENINECNDEISGLMGAEFSFNYEYFTPGSRTSAYLCDVDSEGQLVTQVFYGQAGLYKVMNGSNITFLRGKPVKSTARFMNLFRVLNYANMVPMGGSASFYTAVLPDGDSELSRLFAPHVNGDIRGFFIKILMHEVYEVRNPAYHKMPMKQVRTVLGETVSMQTNPAQISITGSITPWMSTDMKTTSVSRILKNAPTNIIAINTVGIPDPIPFGGSTPLGIPANVNLAPVPFVINTYLNFLSLDLSNMLHEYGTNAGSFPAYAGSGDIAPYTQFENYNYGNFNVMFQPDTGGNPLALGTITYDDYNMKTFVATAGMVDILLPRSANFSLGAFYISLNGVSVLLEDDLYITTDQQGIYAEQNQSPAGLYLSDGLPRIPFTFRVFERGVPVSTLNAKTITMQAFSFITNNLSNIPISVYDGMAYTFPVDNNGCTTYIVPTNANEQFPVRFSIAAFGYLAMNSCLVVCRVLSANANLAPYLNGTLPITWQVVFENVLQVYKTIYPIMDVILPIREQTWSDPLIQAKILSLTNESNWGKPLFMPVTRDMSAAQRQLLHMWINQSNLSTLQDD